MTSRPRLFAIAPLVALFALAASSLDNPDVGWAQTPSPTPKPAESATAGVESTPAIDLEKHPPKDRDTKFEPEGWSTAPRVKLARPENVTGRGFGSLGHDNCELRVKGDWLRVWCKGGTGRVHQLAGDTKNVVIHISNQVVAPNPQQPWNREDRRRLAVFVRLVPGEVIIVESTGMSFDNYNGQDWEGGVGVLTVDWFDESKGPTVLITQPAGGYSL